MFRTLYRKLFLAPYYFTIGIRKRSDISILKETAFTPEFIKKANFREWAADPILVDDGSRTWLFYEAVSNDQGRIEVAEVFSDCSLSEPTIILQDSGHYSYPFVFNYENRWFMIPESSSAKEVRLYESIDFPYKWTMKNILLKERAVDTTVFEHEGNIYLETFLPDSSTERVAPHIYKVTDLLNNTVLNEIQWEQYDALRVRGAGPLFCEEDQLIRPAQISEEYRYGDALAFFRIENSDPYKEVQVGTLTSVGILGTKGYVDGLHTYCRSNNFEAIDIRRRDFDFFKVPKSILRKFRK